MIRRILLIAAVVTPLAADALSGQEVPPVGPFSLEGLVVTAAPVPILAESVAANVTVLEGARLRERGLATVADALRFAASLDIVRGGSMGAATSLFLRGGESDYVLVLLDGVEVNQPGGAFDFAGLMLSNVERIEVVRGTSSALYGSGAVSGVIHVITRSGSGALRAEAATGAGTFGTRRATASVRAGSDRAGYALSFERSSTDGTLAFNNRHVNQVLSGSARFALDDRTRADVTLRLGDRRFHFPTDGSGRVVDRNAFTFGDETTVGFRLRRDLTPGLAVEVRVGSNQQDGGTDDAQDGPADTLGFFGLTTLDHFRSNTLDARTHLALPWGMLSGGVEFEQERQRSFTESMSAFGSSFGRSSNERVNRAGYAHLTASAGAASLQIGGRLEDNERFGRFGTWQVGGAMELSEATGTRARAAVGRALKEPTFFENYSTGFAVGNPNLDPERSTSWEVGVDQPLGKRAVVRATIFDQSFSDLIQYAGVPTEPGGTNFYNVAAAASRGLEVEVSARSEVVDASLGWTWLATEVIDSGFDEGSGATFVEGEALLRRPRVRGSAALSARLSGDRVVHLDVTRVGERSDRDFSAWPASPVVLPAYTRLGIGTAWTVPTAIRGIPAIAVDVRIDNVLDSSYEEILGFASPGRSLFVGGRVSFGPTVR